MSTKPPKMVQIEFTPYQSAALGRLTERFGATAKALVVNALNDYLARHDPIRVILLDDEKPGSSTPTPEPPTSAA